MMNTVSTESRRQLACARIDTCPLATDLSAWRAAVCCVLESIMVSSAERSEARCESRTARDRMANRDVGE